MAALMKFERTEKKYLLTPNQFDALSRMLAPKMTIDQYGEHTISNIYYDTVDYRLIQASIQKPEYKEKLRVRSYKTPQANDKVFIELKKKCGGIVYKRRDEMTLAQSNAFLLSGVTPPRESQIIQEIAWFRDFYHPVPKVLLAYDRIAFYGNEDPGLRITFDRDIRWRQTALDLSMGDWGVPLCEDKGIIMEIKLVSGMPMWLCHALTRLNIYPSSFSKYGTVYQQHLVYDNMPMKGEDHCA